MGDGISKLLLEVGFDGREEGIGREMAVGKGMITSGGWLQRAGQWKRIFRE